MSAVTLGLAPLAAQTPSLVELAEQERARRAQITEESRVYTNDDLRGGGRLTTGRAPTADPVPATEAAERATSAPAAEPDGDPVVQDEAYWRERITDAREQRQRAELMVAALQNRVDGLWAAFTARDDPLERRQIELDRTTALQELERTEAEVERLDEEIRTIQEDARRAGVPPGWLR